MYHIPSESKHPARNCRLAVEALFDREPVMKTGAQGPRSKVSGLGNLDWFLGVGGLFGVIGTRTLEPRNS